MTPEQQLQAAVLKWNSRLEQAILAIANQRRKAKGEKPLPSNTHVHLPLHAAASQALVDGMNLLNLKVWTLRYGVSPEFALEAVIKHQERIYHQDCLLVQQTKSQCRVVLTLRAARLGGAAARKAVEAAVLQTYPHGENWTDIKTQAADVLVQLELPSPQPRPGESEHAAIERYLAETLQYNRERARAERQLANPRRHHRRRDAWIRTHK